MVYEAVKCFRCLHHRCRSLTCAFSVNEEYSMEQNGLGDDIYLLIAPSLYDLCDHDGRTWEG